MPRTLRLWLALLALALAGCAAAPGSAPAANEPRAAELTVFAAASLTDAFKEIGAGFEAANPGVKVVFNFAGSQQLAQQIGQGAPADVFASANQAQMDVALGSGRVDAAAVRVFATNQLVVVTTPETEGVARLQDLAGPGVKLVLADPAVPVGRYALEFLDRAAGDPAFGADFRAKVEANVVSYEESVRAVLAKVALGEADAGVVYVSDVFANPDNAVGRIDIPAGLNVLAAYPIAPLRDSPNAELARAFVQTIDTDGAAQILAKYGFTRP